MATSSRARARATASSPSSATFATRSRPPSCCNARSMQNAGSPARRFASAWRSTRDRSSCATATTTARPSIAARRWEASVDREAGAGDALVACREVTTLRQVALPTLTAQHHARFAVLCTQAAWDGGLGATEFNSWANSWLAGQDTSGVNARELADELEAEAHRGTGLAHPELLMGANAARAAVHASKISWLVGRARDEENSRA